MAPKKLYLSLVLLVLIILVFRYTSEATTGRKVQEKSFKYMGACNTQAQCADMCNGAGFDPHAIYCDLHRAGGAQCCCVQS